MHFMLWKMVILFSHLVTSDSFETPWAVAHQVPLSMGFFRQEYWSGLPFPFPGGLPDSGIEPASPASAGGFFYHCTTREAQNTVCNSWLFNWFDILEFKLYDRGSSFSLRRDQTMF